MPVNYRISTYRKPFLFLFILLLMASEMKGQSVGFELKTSPNLNFTFNTIASYQTGITQMNAVTLNIVATGTQWDLYVGATTTVSGLFDVVQTYSGSGNLPGINIVELRFRNTSNTSQQSGFFTLTDILTPIYIIGSNTAPDAAVPCPGVGTNQPGSYVSSPNCYQFKVDIRIKPGLGYRPGLYTIRIDYVIVQDL